MLNVYFLKNAPTTKAVRATVYCARVLFIMTFVALVGAGAWSMSLRLLESTISGNEAEEQSDSEFNPIMLVLPYVTFVPLILVIELMISVKQEKIGDN